MSLQVTATERGPQALADTLDSLMQSHEQDTEVCRTLRVAREQLRVLAWTRFKARHERSDKRAILCRRHQGHKLAREARTHA